MAKHSVAPEVLGDRPSLSHNRYRHAGEALSLTEVSVSHGTRVHGVIAPSGDGVTSRRLRRFALALSRVMFPEIKKHAKRWGVSTRTLEVASHIVATRLYQKAYADDPTEGTTSVATLARLLNEPKPNSAVFLEAFRYIDTQAYEQLKSVVSPEVNAHLTDMGDAVSRLMSYYYSGCLDINSSRDYRRRTSKKYWHYLADALEQSAERAADAIGKTHEQERQAKMTKARTEYGKGKPAIAEGEGWYPLVVSKPPLDIPHTGKLGRRNIYTNEGKYPRNIGRLMTDPERRIFTRKTRSLGAVVVIDCSGSMGLSDDDLRALMKSSAGATVLCYSTGEYPNADHPNAWVVARKGRQVRSLPEFPGGNGCDAPALKYGLTLRSSSTQPVIWVSDGQVTGIGDRSSVNLKEQCRAIVRRNGIRRARNVREAVQLMTKLQGGKQ